MTKRPTHTGIRTFEMTQTLTAPIPCESMKDLPSNIQDAVMAALERMAARVGLPLAIVHVSCEIDHGATKEEDKPFLRVIASEAVVADERQLAKGRLH